MSGTIVITGASRGIGRTLAERAQTCGWRVIGLSRTAPTLEGIAHIACDVGDAASVATAFARLKSEPELYGLINAAGAAAMNLLVTMPPETIERILRINLLGTILCCRAMAPLLMRRKKGRIINLSSIAVPLAIKGEAVYAASKAGIESFSRSFAREMAEFGITVNSVAPGPVATGMIAGLAPERIAEIVARQVITRQAEPGDVWDTIALLLDPQSRWLTGCVFPIGGV